MFPDNFMLDMLLIGIKKNLFGELRFDEILLRYYITKDENQFKIPINGILLIEQCLWSMEVN